MELVRQAESKTLARKTCASMLPQSFDDTLAAALPGAGVFRKPIGIKLLHYADCNINVSSPSGTRTLDQDFVKQGLSGDNLALFCSSNGLGNILILTNIPTGWYVLSMGSFLTRRSSETGSRQKLLNASLALVRQKGYTATSVDGLCEAAGVTKGAFFHHFKSKDDLGVASAKYWAESTGAFFAAAPYHSYSDPLDRVLGYLEFRKTLLAGTLAEISCLAGTMVQEVYSTHPEIARACAATIFDHAANIEKDIAAAMKLYRIRGEWTAHSLALHTQVVLQGAFILAKAKDGVDVAIESIDHLRRYIELLFKNEKRKGRVKPSEQNLQERAKRNQ